MKSVIVISQRIQKLAKRKKDLHPVLSSDIGMIQQLPQQRDGVAFPIKTMAQLGESQDGMWMDGVCADYRRHQCIGPVIVALALQCCREAREHIAMIGK